MSLNRTNQTIKLAVDEAFLIPDVKTGVIYGVRGKIVGSVNFEGYLAYKFRGNNLLIHRVIGYAAWGDKVFTDGLVINHKNGVKTDNRILNLELVTVQGNNQHAFNTGLRYNPFGDKALNAKLTQADVNQLRALTKQGLTQRQIAGIFNITQQTVSDIVKGKTWRKS